MTNKFKKNNKENESSPNCFEKAKAVSHDHNYVCHGYGYVGINYIVIHKEAKGVWDLRFPYLEVSETIYAKDRATGRGALGFEEAIGQMEADLEIDQSMSINLDDLNVEDDPSEAPTSRSQDSELSKKRKKLAAVRGNDAKKMRGSSSIAHDAKVEGLRKELSAAFQGMSTHLRTIENRCVKKGLIRWLSNSHHLVCLV
nr:myb/SANT-like domain-containing protein [Ipomoea batatas]